MPTPNCISGRELQAATLKWNLHPQREYHFKSVLKERENSKTLSEAVVCVSCLGLENASFKVVYHR